MPRIAAPTRLIALVTSTALAGACANLSDDPQDGQALMKPGEDPNAPFESPGILRQLLTGGLAAAPASAADGPIGKLGVVLPADLDAELENTFDSALSASAASQPVVLVGDDELAQHLRGYGCAADSITQCLDRLAVYPGVRMLAVVERLQPQEGAIEASVRLYDVAYDLSYAPVLVSIPTANDDSVRAAMRRVTDKIVSSALERSGAAPWSTRTFGREGEQWLVAAGRQSGLAPGDMLAIHGQGRVLAGPSGVAAGWAPGPKLGELRVTSLVGEDAATAELIAGQPPESNHHLLFDDR